VQGQHALRQPTNRRVIRGERMTRKTKQHPHINPWMLLPADPGKCPECAVEHDPALPHNQQSLFYQYDFYGKHGRWPTWADAMKHCTPEMQDKCISELEKHGITVKYPNNQTRPLQSTDP